MHIHKKALWIIVLFSIAFCYSHGFSETYYISPTGNDSIGSGSTSKPWRTIKKAFSSMSGGDTLVCKDGIYSGDLNIWGTIVGIGTNAYPPSGTSTAWTVVKAEHDGEAIFDGEYTRQMAYLAQGGNKYWQFEGILWCKAPDGGCPFGIFYSQYVKLLRCGSYDAGNGNATQFNIGRENGFVLLENCYSYGNGRYGICVYLSTACVLRQCVVRSDRDNAWNGSSYEPIGGISVYSSNNVEVQNCIVIDADQEGAFIEGERAGSFNCPATDFSGANITFRKCLALNNLYGGMCSSALAGASSILFENCVVWNTWSTSAATPDDSGYLNLPYGYDTKYINCIFGMQPTNGYIIRSAANNATTVKNSIIYGSTYAYRAFRDIENESYNSFYNVANVMNMDAAGTDHPVSGTDILTANPIWNALNNPTGALKYITRVESGSNLSAKGDGGLDIGANVATLVGTPGTLWGEEGYNTVTGVSMWPFPHEALIRSKMRAYTGGGVSGARGFCADGQSLTKYIWEYLGNEMPLEYRRSIKGKVQDVSGKAAAGVTLRMTEGATDTTKSDSSGNYEFSGLVIGQNYVVAPVKEGYTFSPPLRTVSNFAGVVSDLNFTVAGIAISAFVQKQELRVLGSSSQQGAINPANGDPAKIYFRGNSSGTYVCRVFDMNRQLVWEQTKENLSMGMFEWFARDVASGGYIVNVKGPEYNQTGKIAVIK